MEDCEIQVHRRRHYIFVTPRAPVYRVLKIVYLLRLPPPAFPAAAAEPLPAAAECCCYAACCSLLYISSIRSRCGACSSRDASWYSLTLM